MYANDKLMDRNEYLPYVTLTYNTSRQESTGHTPFFLLHGRELRPPVEVTMGALPAPIWFGGQDDVPTKLWRTQKKIVDHLFTMQKKQIEAVDKGGRTQIVFTVGDLVLIYNPSRIVGRFEKLLHRWRGPYSVVRQKSGLNSEVKLSRGRRTTFVHVVRMIRFISSGGTGYSDGTTSAS